MAEWSNVPDSKSGVPQGTVGSNPTLSANHKKSRPMGGFFVDCADYLRSGLLVTALPFKSKPLKSSVRTLGFSNERML